MKKVFKYKNSKRSKILAVKKIRMKKVKRN